jgi:hypothetical protein
MKHMKSLKGYLLKGITNFGQLRCGTGERASLDVQQVQTLVSREVCPDGSWTFTEY